MKVTESSFRGANLKGSALGGVQEGRRNCFFGRLQRAAPRAAFHLPGIPVSAQRVKSVPTAVLFPGATRVAPGAMWIGEDLGVSPYAAAQSQAIATDLRNQAGIASGSGSVVDGIWLRGTNGNAGVFPRITLAWKRGSRLYITLSFEWTRFA
jgi:hypothetical protein